MKKFKKSYIALLAGILAFGVGAGSLVSSVTLSKAEAIYTVEEVVTVNFSALGLANNDYVTSIQYDYIKFESDPGLGNFIPYYSSGYVRLGVGANFSISTTIGSITEIEFTCVDGYSLSSFNSTNPSDISISGNTVTCDSTSKVEFTETNTELRIRQIDVTLSVLETELYEDIPETAHVVKFSGLNINDGESLNSLTSGYITVNANIGSGDVSPRYYSSGYIALRAGNQFNISTSVGSITKVYFTMSSTDYSVYDFRSSTNNITIYGNTITCDSTAQLSLRVNASMSISQIAVVLTDENGAIIEPEAKVEKTITANFSNLEGFISGDPLNESTKLVYDYITVYFTNYDYEEYRESYYVSSHASGTVNISTSLGVITKIEFTIQSGDVSNFTSDTTFTVDGNTLIFDNGGASVSLLTSSSIRISQIVVTLELATLEQAIYWADSFYNGIVCDNGVTPPDKDAWDELGEEYAELTEGAKTYFANDRTKNASQSIEAAILKYDYIINKYKSTGNYENFIGREPEVDSANTISSVTNNIDYVTIIAIVVSVVALTSIGAFIIIYRRKRLSSK